MSWYAKKKPKIAASVEADEVDQRSAPSRMEGLWVKCEPCGEILLREELERALNVCPSCNHHMAWNARARMLALCDEGSFEEHDEGLEAQDPLGFSDSKKYRDRIKSTRKALNENDAFVSGTARIDGQHVSIGAFLFEFMGGSMGSVVGEKVTRVFERARELDVPAIVFSSSGGARMQEGILSLMQMAKTCAALNRFREVRKPYISVLLNPTTGGVAASFSWLGDVVIAEPRALIGFAGARVIEQTIRQKLPEGFQRSEFLLEHGMIDAIVQRKELRAKLSQIIGLLS
ncbi:MAG: acetyl-CoA carboxylase carboxyltransferase subunit beta [Myxococcus sp.]|nr:acetyl-CoA carboxylase carboxyltransferase subunit beta [Myxococcus sp.]